MPRLHARLVLLVAAAPRASSFGRLEAAESAECVDDDAGCAQWAVAGECQHNPSYMNSKCRRACRQCEVVGAEAAARYAACVDEHKECVRWSRDGECDANPTFMRTACARPARSASRQAATTHTSRARRGQRRANACPTRLSCSGHAGTRANCAASTTSKRATATQRCSPPLSPGRSMPPSASSSSDSRTCGRACSRDPWVVYFDEFMPEADVDHLVKVGGHEFKRSLAGDGVTPVRTSATSWCNVDSCLRDELFQRTRERISNMTRVPWTNAEHLQLLRYTAGQFYREHHDQAPRRPASARRARVNPVCPPPATSRGRDPARTWKKRGASCAELAALLGVGPAVVHVLPVPLGRRGRRRDALHAAEHLGDAAQGVGGRVAVGHVGRPLQDG